MSTGKDQEAYASLVNFAAAALAQTDNPKAIEESICTLFLRPLGAFSPPESATQLDLVNWYSTTPEELIQFLKEANALALAAAKPSVNELESVKEECRKLSNLLDGAGDTLE